jgi:hypothetical protein
MNRRIFDAFDAREAQVQDFMAGCASRYGMSCTCGPDCRCAGCPCQSKAGAAAESGEEKTNMDNQPSHSDSNSLPSFQQDALLDEPLQIDQPMNFFGIAPPVTMPVNTTAAIPLMPDRGSYTEPLPLSYGISGMTNISSIDGGNQLHSDANTHTVGFNVGEGHVRAEGGRRASRRERNPSVLSYGNGPRGMSITSETTFGRAMSGLSALSIDWETLDDDDFDLEVDHSAHINNTHIANSGVAAAATHPTPNHSGTGMLKRSSLRRSYVAEDQEGIHVSFKT